MRGALSITSELILASSVVAGQHEVILPSQVEPAPVVCNEAAEPLAMSYGMHTSACSIGTVVDLDSFVFDGVEGEVVRVCVNTTTALDPRLEVRSPSNQPIFDDFCTGACSLCGDIVLPESGQYTIRISDAGANQTGSYTLQLERLAPVLEPLDIPFGSAVSDSIDPITDHDFLTFDGDAGQDVRLLVNTTTALDPLVVVTGPDGAELVNQFCTGSCSLKLDFQLDVTGTHVISVSDSGRNQTGGYTLQLERIPPTAATAALPIGSTVVDAIGLRTDLDAFRMSGAAGTEIRWLVSTSTALDPTIEIWTPSGDPLPPESCTGSCSLDESVVLPETGTYHIAISDAGVNDTGTYSISAQCLFGNCGCLEADVDGNGAVAFADIIALLAAWGPCPEGCEPGCVNTPDDCVADLDRDCSVTFADLLQLIAAWGPCS